VVRSVENVGEKKRNSFHPLGRGGRRRLRVGRSQAKVPAYLDITGATRGRTSCNTGEKISKDRAEKIKCRPTQRVVIYQKKTNGTNQNPLKTVGETSPGDKKMT